MCRAPAKSEGCDVAQSARKRIKEIIGEVGSGLGLGVPIAAAEEDRHDLAQAMGLTELPAAVDEFYCLIGGEGDVVAKALFEGLFDPSISAATERVAQMHRKAAPATGAVPFGLTPDAELWLDRVGSDPRVWSRDPEGKVQLAAASFTDLIAELAGMRLVARSIGWEDPVVSVAQDGVDVVVALSSMFAAAESALVELKRL